MKTGRNYINSYADRLMRVHMVGEVGAFLDHLVSEEVTCPKLIKQEFGIDYKTIKALRMGSESVSFETLRKFCYVFAFYLCQYKDAIANTQRWVNDKEEKIAKIDRLIHAYKDIYGMQAAFCLELVIHQHQDLRDIVNHEKRLPN